MLHLSNSRGFTLVELVAVIAVISILAAVTMPRFASNDVFQARGDTAMLASALRYAQKTAIAQRTNVFCLVSSSQVKVCYDSGCTTAIKDPATNSDYIKNFASTVVVVASLASFNFDGLGKPSSNTNLTYTVTNSKNASQSNTVTVEAETGYVR